MGGKARKGGERKEEGKKGRKERGEERFQTSNRPKSRPA
jgi:hypothetical protein